MGSLLPRGLLAGASAIFGIGGALHAAAFFSSAGRRIDGAALPAFMRAELKVLWLADSTTLISLALVYGFLAANPRRGDGPTVALVALIPGATTLLLYAYLGPFYAGHLLLAGTAMAAAAGALLARSPQSEKRALEAGGSS